MDETHAVPSKLGYFWVYAALMALLLITVEISKIDLGDWNLAASLLIATAKSALIMIFFMHLRQCKGVTVFFALSGVVWLVILYGLAFTDYLSRGFLDLAGK